MWRGGPEAEDGLSSGPQGLVRASGKLAGFNSDPQTHVHMKPVNVTLLGNGVLADIIKFQLGLSGLEEALRSM